MRILTSRNLKMITSVTEDEALRMLKIAVFDGMVDLMNKAIQKGEPMDKETVGNAFVESLRWMHLAIEEREKWLNENSEAEI